MKAGPKRGWRQGDFYYLQYNMSSFQIGVQFHILVGVETIICLCRKWARVNQHPPVHQCGWMVHWWCTFFIPPCPWANQGGKLKLIFFFSFPQPRLIFFGNLFISSPLTVSQVSPTYLHLDYLPMHLSLLPPHLLTYLPTYPPIYLPIHPFAYLPNNLPTYVGTH